MSKVIRICKNCRDPFTARQADVDRGWARFCSKLCKARHQEQRTGQNAAYDERQDRRDYDAPLATGAWADGHDCNKGGD